MKSTLLVTNILISILLINSISIHASSQIDSLISLTNNKLDTEKADFLLEIGNVYKNEYIHDKALDYYNQALILFENTDDEIKIANTLYNIGLVHKSLRNYDKTIDAFEKALIIREKIGDKTEITKVLNNLGNAYKYKGNFDKSVSYYIRALQLIKATKNKAGIAKTLNNIGILFSNLKDYSKSLDYFNRSLKIKMELNDSIGIGGDLNNIGVVHKNIGKHQEALSYFNQSLSYQNKFNDHKGLTSTLNNIGNLHRILKNYADALDSYKKLLSLKRETNNPMDLAMVHNNIGNVHAKLNDFKSAKLHLDTALWEATQTGDLNELANNYWYTSQLYDTQNKYRKAYEYLSLYNSIRDSIYSIDEDGGFKLAEARFNFNKLEQELRFDEEKRAQITKVISISITLTLILISLILYRMYRLKSINNTALLNEKKKAQESDRLKSAFLANMSHEIRTPMNAILGFTDLLKDSTLTLDEKNAYLNIIEDGGQRMLSIINDLIDISKIESGLIQLNISPINLNQELDSVYRLLQHEANKKGIELRVVNGIEIRCKSDSEKIQAVLINLVKNAIKFTSSGSVEFGYSIKNQHIEFHVRDTGIGIRQEKLKLIFERFIQGEPDAIQEGTGLGLAISKAYIEILGGRIWVKSVINEGSCFYFTLPIQSSKKHLNLFLGM